MLIPTNETVELTPQHIFQDVQVLIQWVGKEIKNSTFVTAKVPNRSEPP